MSLLSEQESKSQAINADSIQLKAPDVQEAILYLAWEEDSLDLSLVKREFFVMEHHRLLWDAILDWKQEKKPKDIALFCAEHKLGLNHIWVKCNEYQPSPFNFESYVKHLEETSLQYKVYSVIDSLSALSPQDSIQTMREYVKEFDRQESDSISIVGSKEYADIYLADIEKRREIKEPELTTGFPLLDERLWGLSRGELVTIAAGTSKGKSTFLLNVAIHLIKKGKKVLYFSTEMSKQDKWDRLIANSTSIEYWKLRKANFNELEWTAIVKQLEWLHKNNNFFVCDNVGLDLFQIGLAIEKVTPDIVILDYLGLFRIERSERRDIGIGEFMAGLKGIARTKNLSVLLASQLNRAVEGRNKKIPTLADLKDSSSIEQESDVVLLLYDNVDSINDMAAREMKLSIEKNRHGECGLIDLVFLTPFLQMKEKAI